MWGELQISMTLSFDINRSIKESQTRCKDYIYEISHSARPLTVVVDVTTYFVYRVRSFLLCGFRCGLNILNRQDPGLFTRCLRYTSWRYGTTIIFRACSLNDHEAPDVRARKALERLTDERLRRDTSRCFMNETIQCHRVGETNGSTRP